MTSLSKLHEESNETQKVTVEDMGNFPNAVSGKSCNGSESLEPLFEIHHLAPHHTLKGAIGEELTLFFCEIVSHVHLFFLTPNSLNEYLDIYLNTIGEVTPHGGLVRESLQKRL